MSADVSEAKALSMLKAAEEDLIKKAKDAEEEREKEELHALLARIRFTRLFLQSMLSLYPVKVWRSSRVYWACCVLQNLELPLLLFNRAPQCGKDMVVLGMKLHWYFGLSV